jgi:hypothetical protein
VAKFSIGNRPLLLHARRGRFGRRWIHRGDVAWLADPRTAVSAEIFAFFDLSSAMSTKHETDLRTGSR